MRRKMAILFASRYDLVLATARRYAPNPSLAHDIAQQAFVVFFDNATKNSWDVDNKLDALLHGIVKNIARQIWAKEKKNSSEAMKLISERFFRQTPTDDDEVCRQTRRIEILRTCMSRLSEKNREIIDLYYKQGIRLDEIGKRNGMKHAAVRQLLCRLRAKLRDCISKTLEKEEKS